MELNRPPILTVSESNHAKFQEACSQMYEAEYKMVSSSCGIINSDEYNFCPYFEAIFIDKTLEP